MIVNSKLHCWQKHGGGGRGHQGHVPPLPPPPSHHLPLPSHPEVGTVPTPTTFQAMPMLIANHWIWCLKATQIINFKHNMYYWGCLCDHRAYANRTQANKIISF